MTTVTIRPGVTRQGEGGNKKRAKYVAVRPWLDSIGETRPGYSVGIFTSALHVPVTTRVSRLP